MPWPALICGVIVFFTGLISFRLGLSRSRVFNPPMLRIIYWAVKLVEARNSHQPWKVTNALDCELEAAVNYYNDYGRAGGKDPSGAPRVVRTPDEIQQVISDMRHGDVPENPSQILAKCTIEVLSWVVGGPSVCETTFKAMREIIKNKEKGDAK